jgi:F0F1-type ATP synthase membrane subunit a
MIELLAAGDPTSHILPHDLIPIGPAGHPYFWITNHMIMAVVAAVLMVVIFPILFRRTTADAPTGARNFFESILEFLRVEVFRPALKEHTDRFVPFLWTLFFFILFCNLLGFIPLGDLFGLVSRGKLSHVGGTATGSISTNIALAISAFVMIHVSGIVQIARDLIRGTYGHHENHEEHSSNGSKGHEAAHDLAHARGEALPADVPQDPRALGNPGHHYHDDEHVRHAQHEPTPGPHGERGHGGVHEHTKGLNPVAAVLLAVPLYFWNFAPHPFRPGPGDSPIGWAADIPVWLLLLVLELIGALIKPFALMIRLFANMIAGHLVLAVLVSFIAGPILVQLAVGGPVVILSLLIRMLELFVSFLQAYIFTFLTTLFIASAVAPEH